MKLTIKNKVSVVLSFLLKKILIAFLLFVVSLLVLAVATSADGGFFDWVKTLILPLIFLGYHIINISKYSQKTYFETKDNGISVYSGNLTKDIQSNILYPQIKNINVLQPFRLKIFGICSLDIIQSNGSVTSAWGFDLKEAKEFIDFATKNFKVKINTTIN